jgi:hypothetical protein
MRGILQRAILEQLKTCSRFDVWDDPAFAVSVTADHLVDGSLNDPKSLIGTDGNYVAQGHRTLQIDVIVFDKRTGSLSAYEIKRGAGDHDAGKRRSIMRDMLCVQILLKSYGKSRGPDVTQANSYVIFYYGHRSIPSPFGIMGDEIDKHFGMAVKDAVEEAKPTLQATAFFDLNPVSVLADLALVLNARRDAAMPQRPVHFGQSPASLNKSRQRFGLIRRRRAAGRGKTAGAALAVG